MAEGLGCEPELDDASGTALKVKIQGTFGVGDRLRGKFGQPNGDRAGLFVDLIGRNHHVHHPEAFGLLGIEALAQKKVLLRCL
jgi:hypothetical protein